MKEIEAQRYRQRRMRAEGEEGKDARDMQRTKNGNHADKAG